MTWQSTLPAEEGLWLHEGDTWPILVHLSHGEVWYFSRCGGCHFLDKKHFPGRWFRIVVPPIDD